MGLSLCMGVGAAAFVIWMVFLVRDALRHGRRGAERWGTIEIRHEAQRGPGAFRSGALTERRPHGAPWIVWVAGLLGAWMGMGRVLAFLLLIGAALDTLSRAHTDGFLLLPYAALLGAMLSLLLSWLLHSTSLELLRCMREAGARARRVGLIAIGLDVAILVPIAATVEPVDRFAYAGVAFLLVGAMHGALLALAGHRTHRRQAILSDEEWDALPEE